MIFADIPGVDVEDIDITMENAVLIIRGQRGEQATPAANIYKRRERPTGLFYRRFVLPDTTDAEGISAQAKQGVLQVIIPKRQKALARRIRVEE